MNQHHRNTPQRTVYLVDDNVQFRTSAQWWLSGAGYAVRDFDDPQAALDALCRMADDEPDALRHACLLLDVRMPGMSGLDLHDRLADSGITLPTDNNNGNSRNADAGPVLPARPTLPVVYMTGHGDVPLAVSAMQKGAVTMLEKPFADNALEAALERAFAAAESAWACAQARASSAASAASATSGSSDDVIVAESDGSARSELIVDRRRREDAPSPGQDEYQRRLATLSVRQREIFEGVIAGHLSKQIAYQCGLSIKTVEFHRKAVMSKLQARNAIDLLRMAMTGSVDGEGSPGSPAAAATSAGSAP
jgi:two-component system, LuxR family, response regulator FixJ